MNDRLWNVTEVAEFLGVARKTIYNWSSEQTGPPALKLGRHLRFRRVDVEAWLEKKASTPPEAA